MASEIVVKNLAAIIRNIGELSSKYGHEVRLVAVSKTFPADYIFACYAHGQRHFGENYLDELDIKANELMSKGVTDIRWHYIGRIQSNKIKKICTIPGLWCIETIGSKKHSDILQSILTTLDKKLNIFIQVNTSGEKNKGGIEPNELLDLAKHVEENCQHLSLIGLMTIGSIMESKNPEENVDFENLRQLRDDLSRHLGRSLELSMGMSSDYPLAIKYGSTNVRVGSTIFGQRIYPEKMAAETLE